MSEKVLFDFAQETITFFQTNSSPDPADIEHLILNIKTHCDFDILNNRADKKDIFSMASIFICIFNHEYNTVPGQCQFAEKLYMSFTAAFSPKFTLLLNGAIPTTKNNYNAYYTYISQAISLFALFTLYEDHIKRTSKRKLDIDYIISNKINADTNVIEQILLIYNHMSSNYFLQTKRFIQSLHVSERIAISEINSSTDICAFLYMLKNYVTNCVVGNKYNPAIIQSFMNKMQSITYSKDIARDHINVVFWDLLRDTVEIYNNFGAIPVLVYNTIYDTMQIIQEK